MSTSVLKEIVPERHCYGCDATVYRYRGQSYYTMAAAEQAQADYIRRLRKKRLAWSR